MHSDHLRSPSTRLYQGTILLAMLVARPIGVQASDPVVQDPVADVAAAPEETEAVTQDTDYTYEAEVREPQDGSDLAERTPGFAVSVDTSEATGQVADVSQLLDRTAGVSTRTLGGLGSFATVSVRGSASNQVLILLDGIPLTGSAFSPADVNTLPPDLLEQIEVYRSGVPVWYGSSPMGGAVNLVTRDIHPLLATASGSYGSFSTFKLTAMAAHQLGDTVGGLVGATYLSSAGTFLFYDDRGTPYNTGDDRELDRQNNAFDNLSALVRLRVETDDNLRLDLQQTLLSRHQGIPGLGQNQSRHASLDSFRSVTRAGVAALGFPGVIADTYLALNADLQNTRFIDREGEIGLGNQDNDATFHTFSGLPRLVLYPFGWLDLTLAAEIHLETYENQPLLSPDLGPSGADRVLLAPSMQCDLSFLQRRLVITGGGRLELSSSSFSGEIPFAYASIAPPPDRSDLLATYQLGFRWKISEQPSTLWVRANGGSFQRLPSFIEMYGNSGSVIGNGGLTPETATGGDIGLSLEQRWEPLAVWGEIALFAYDYEDLIQFVQNAQQVARPENIGTARIWGGEISGRLAVPDWLDLSLGYTYVDAEDTSDVAGQAGNQLPGRPRHSLSGHATGRWADLEVQYSLDLDSGNVLDRANYRIVPTRIFHGLRLGYHPTWLDEWSLTAEAHNLLDHRVETVAVLPQPPGIHVDTPQPVADFVGSPLPGRTLFVTLRWENR